MNRKTQIMVRGKKAAAAANSNAPWYEHLGAVLNEDEKKEIRKVKRRMAKNNASWNMAFLHWYSLLESDDESDPHHTKRKSVPCRPEDA